MGVLIITNENGKGVKNQFHVFKISAQYFFLQTTYKLIMVMIIESFC